MNESELPNPKDRPQSAVVIYDGQCNFCISQVRRLNWFDLRGRLSFVSLHDELVAERYPDLTHEQMMKEMYVISPSGDRFGGGDAVRFLSRHLVLLWPAMPILHLPGSANLWRWAYHQVAKRRYKLAGRRCDGDSCEIHYG